MDFMQKLPADGGATLCRLVPGRWRPLTGTEPLVLTPQVYPSTAPTEANSPAGGEAWPWTGATVSVRAVFWPFVH